MGNGGREHALGWKLRRSSYVSSIQFAPGNDGTAAIGRNVDIASDDIDGLRRYAADNKIALTVVGPEAPLVAGIVDVFLKGHLPVFGPSQTAARVTEGSKILAYQFMNAQNPPIPHPRSYPFYQGQVCQALELAERLGSKNIVIKADGLCGGKGVDLPDSDQDAEISIRGMMEEDRFGSAGRNILIQERLKGEELSVLAVTDGRAVRVFPAARDHKRLKDGDKGPNTGGMGAYAPVPDVSWKLQQRIKDEIILPTIRGLRNSGYPFRGVLYAGIMVTESGPKVLEYNCRFGDPEVQPLMMLLRSDLYQILESCTRGTLGLNIRGEDFRSGGAGCIVLAAEGYPDSPKKGELIFGLHRNLDPDIQIFHAGTKRRGEEGSGLVETSGGRVLGVTAYHRQSVDDALVKAYRAIGQQGVHFANMQYRQDIGQSSHR